jgi:chitin-binding protein
MKLDALRTMLLGALLLMMSSAFGHGLIQDPPSRNWFCGAITKPDQVANGTAQYPVCGQAFTAPGLDPSAGYSFMSVLTHTTGRSGVGPRSNVCGFNSESWNGGATPWDQPINWPTTPMTSGSKVFTWNISWGPHFSDTDEFRYWITKPSFVFTVGQPLSFNDFEEAPFCLLKYSDATPNANPDVIPNPGAATFQTRCNVPARTGRHVIYAEWGRNQWTYERFHGCIDAVFQGGTTPTVDAQIALSPDVAEFQGAGSITLDGRTSTGSNLSYQWTVTSQNPSLYTLTNATQSVATLTLGNPQASANVTVSLVVSSGGASDSATRTFVHAPAVASQWFDLGLLTSTSRTLTVGDRVSVRTVNGSGQDAYWPTSPLVITSSNAAATAWPLALAQAVNAANGSVRIGVLNAQSQVVPQASATANRVYSLTSADITSAFLQVTPATTGNGGVTVTPAVTANSPYYNELQLRLSNTAAVTALSATIVVQRTTGVSYSGAYNTLGSQIQQTNSSTSTAITYQYTLASGTTLSSGTNRTFAAQFGGTGTAHPTTGDTYTVTYTSGGVQYTQTGTF